ncbi:M48 family metalloprotease [Micromonospora sp. NPDC023888]|uniref:M48 family metalloprotease n=1 Tax=Micromonospora sp. NPDC023888 TaxID=3155607 RepID=UPI0033C64F83
MSHDVAGGQGSPEISVFGFISDAALLNYQLAVAIFCSTLYFATMSAIPLSLSLGLPTDPLSLLGLGQNVNYLVAVLTLVGYETYVVTRARRWRRIGGPDFQNALDVVTDVSLEMECRVPRLLVDPELGGRAMVGRAGYLRRRFCLVVGPDLLALAGKPSMALRQRFEAVVRHEVGHIANNDVRMYRQASFFRLWYGVWCALVLLSVPVVVAADPDRLGDLRWSTFVVLLISMIGIELLLRAFLRSREFFADLRAAEGGGTDLAALLRDDRRPDAGQAPHGQLRSFLRRHPTINSRREVLADQSLLLRMPAQLMLLAGIVAGFGFAIVDQLFASIDPNQSPAFTPVRVMFTVALVGVPLGLFVAQGMWREVWHSRSAGRPVRFVTLGASLGFGLTVGDVLMPFNLVARPTYLGVDLTARIIGAVALCLFVATLASAWLRLFPAVKPTKWFHAVATMIAILATCGFVGLAARGQLPTFVLMIVLLGACAACGYLVLRRAALVEGRPTEWASSASLSGLVLVGTPLVATAALLLPQPPLLS